jgi:superfamily II helicase
MPVNNTNSFLVNLDSKNMSKTIFIKEIITITKEPKLCPTCLKEDRLEKDIIREEKSGGKTILCSRCEALIVITNHKLRQVELSSIRDDTIMLKEPHLIRKVTY